MTYVSYYTMLISYDGSQMNQPKYGKRKRYI